MKIANLGREGQQSLPGGVSLDEPGLGERSLGHQLLGQFREVLEQLGAHVELVLPLAAGLRRRFGTKGEVAVGGDLAVLPRCARTGTGGCRTSSGV